MFKISVHVQIGSVFVFTFWMVHGVGLPWMFWSSLCYGFCKALTSWVESKL